MTVVEGEEEEGGGGEEEEEEVSPRMLVLTCLCIESLSLPPSLPHTQGPTEHTVLWRIQDYDTLTISEGETVKFSWEGFHSLHQVTQEAFLSCDLSASSLHIWAIPSVDTTVPISNLQAGSYYFLCTVAGHCDAGMKIEVIVLPSDGVPVVLNPALGVCHGPNGCSFAYSVGATPTITTVQVSSSVQSCSISACLYSSMLSGWCLVPVPVLNQFGSQTIPFSASTCPHGEMRLRFM